MDRERVKLTDISFNRAFFEDEVREGFFVMTMVKRYWAAQLKVLSIIAKICEKHNINWFADYGTLMGVVRHEGYIPWDDDLDICMLRSDWDKFFEVAKNELPSGYVIMTLSEQEEYRELIGRVTNSHEIDFSQKHLEEYYGCPYTVGVDIFPLDGLYDDPEIEKNRKQRAQKVLDAYGIVCSEGEKSYKLRYLLQDIEKENNVQLKMKPGLERKLVVLLDRIYRECSDVGVNKVALMRFYMSHNNHIYDRKLFESWIEMPFENTYIRVPVRYDEKLRADYGNYMKAVKSGGVHEYPVYSEQEQILKEHIGKNPYRYTMDNQELLRSVSRYIMKATSPVIEKKEKRIVFLPCKAKWWKNMEMFWNCAIQNPNLDVHVIPIPYYERDFTGKIFEKHYEAELFPTNVNGEDYQSFDFEEMHPDIIVVQVPYDGWSTAISVDRLYYSDNLLKVTDELVYIPCFDPDDSEKDGDKAETAIRVLAEQPAVVNADKIILKSERMIRVYLKKLIELTGEPTREYWNQKMILEGDFLDEITENKEDVKESNRGCLSEVKAKNQDWYGLVGNTNGKKVVVYYVSLGFIIGGGGKAFEKIKASLDILESNAERIKAIFLPQKELLNNLARLDDGLWSEYKALIEDMENKWQNCVYDPEGIAIEYIDDWDAFYGDPGFLPRQCVLRNKPVMLQNIDV